MSSLNKVFILGRCGADPDAKQINSGAWVCRLSVATSEKFGKGDAKQERTEWHRVTVWGKLAELCGKYVSKGSQVFVEGRLQTRSWEDKNGAKKYTTEIIASSVQFLGGINTSDSQGSTDNTSDFGETPSFDENDELPF